jgi:lauroyl/myristoyl acyltransferase
MNHPKELINALPENLKVGEDGKLILPVSQKLRGLGDVVAAVAQPIAKTIDFVAKTNLQNCSSCKARQEKLNKIAPL